MSFHDSAASQQWQAYTDRQSQDLKERGRFPSPVGKYRLTACTPGDMGTSLLVPPLTGPVPFTRHKNGQLPGGAGASPLGAGRSGRRTLYMKIINPEILDSLESGKTLRLNLGSGTRSRPGFYNLDRVLLP